MWFSFPKGCERISVERQEFSIEAVGEDGTGFFRAPDHFAGRILTIPGFAIGVPPEGSPEDLPKADPLRDNTIAELAKGAQATQVEMQNLRSDLNAATSRITALSNENAQLKTELALAHKEIEGLKESLEDQTEAEVVPIKGRK